MRIVGQLRLALDGKGMGETETIRAEMDDRGAWTVIRGGRDYLNIYAITGYDDAGLRRLIALAGESPDIE